MAHLRIRLFGAFQVTVDGAAASGFASDKTRALLAYLVVEAGQPHRREKLAGLLWPDYPEGSAHANLRTALANLRQVIQDPSAAPPFLLISRQAIQFNRAASVWTDVDAFADLSGGSDLEALAQAADLYRGDLLEGFSLGDASTFEEWALLHRERYRRLVGDTLRRLVDGHADRGEFEQALPHAWRQVELDPWREPAHQQLMRLLAFSGRRTEALIQYDTCCRLLADELGVAPAETTVALSEQIRSGELAAAGQPPVRLPGPAAQPPPFVEQEEAAGAEWPTFVARENELARLTTRLDLVMEGKGSVLFVCGEAGSGKTSLMAEFARQAMNAQGDLVVAGGECSAYLGFGDHYLPFRRIWAMLTGDLQAHWPAGGIRLGHARRLQQAMLPAIDALLEYGPQVLDIFLQTESLLARAALAVHENDPRLRRLRQRLDLARLHPLDLDQNQLFQQTTNTLRALSATQPLLLILDDLQWADTASLSLLFHLGRRLGGSRILILAAYRPEEVDLWSGEDRHPLQKVLAEFRRTYGDVIIDLDQAEEAGRAFVDAFLDSEPNRLGEDFRSVLFGHTAGHPLFTIELLRAMQERGDLIRDEAGCTVAGPALDWDSLPARVEGVMEERLGRLGEDLCDILRVACVEGDRFTVQVSARMLDIDERRLLRNLSRELGRGHRLVHWLGELQAGERRLLCYRFAHPLLRQYLYTSLSPGERQLLHRDTAAILADLYEAHTDAIASQLAHHYSEAGDDVQALRYLTLAADAALAGFAGDEAEACYRRALDLVQDSSQRSHLLEGLGRALARRTCYSEALEAWQEAIELCEAGGDLEGMARLYARSSYAAWLGGTQTLALRLCEKGLEATGGAPESAGRARLLHQAARTYSLGGYPEQAWSFCEEALRMAEQSGAVDVQADALVTLGGLPGQAAQDALARFARAVQLAEGANLLGTAARAHNNLAIVTAPVRGFRAARNELDRAIQLSRQTGHVALEIRARSNLVEASLELGELEAARASLSKIRQLSADLDDAEPAADRIRRLEAAVLVYEGDWRKAASRLRLCQDAYRQRNDLPGLLTADLYLVRALLEVCFLERSSGSRDWAEVERVLAEAAELGQMMGEAEGSVDARANLARVYAGQGRLSQARDQLAGARAAARDWPSSSTVAAALQWADARLATAEQRWAEALTAFESLAETCMQYGLRWVRARILIDWAAAHEARGDVADFARAIALLEESHALYQEMGIPRYMALVQERLAALSGRG